MLLLKRFNLVILVLIYLTNSYYINCGDDFPNSDDESFNDEGDNDETSGQNDMNADSANNNLVALKQTTNVNDIMNQQFVTTTLKSKQQQQQANVDENIDGGDDIDDENIDDNEIDSENNEDIDDSDLSTEQADDDKSNDNNYKELIKQFQSTSSLTPDYNGNRNMLKYSRSKLFEILSKPGILAGIVGGIVIGLLTAILLIMFIVYRMRKKDEGSYALTEDTKKPLSSYEYRNVPTKEFYA